MSIFNTLMQKVFGQTETAQAKSTVPSTGPTSLGTPPATETRSSASAPNAGAAVPTQVDVESVLNSLAAKNSESLDWKHSIVDLLKLVGLDSSLSARKELATELHYPGDQSDSAAMNVWLHKAVLQKLAQNGGKVPAELLSH